LLSAAFVASAGQQVLVLGAEAVVLVRAGARALSCQNAPGCGSSSVISFAQVMHDEMVAFRRG